jgi:hypothetical protein
VAVRVGGWCLGQRTVAGITLGRTIFLADAAVLAPALLLHEAAHARQFASIRTFAVQYVWQSLRHGYSRNRFEREADAFAAVVLAERPAVATGGPLASSFPPPEGGRDAAMSVSDRSTQRST